MERRKSSSSSSSCVVLYPSLGLGHILPALELGKRLLLHQKEQQNFSVIILITVPPFDTEPTETYLRMISHYNASIHFYYLPKITEEIPTTYVPEFRIFKMMRVNNPNVLHALSSISQTKFIRALIIDFFCYPAVNVALELQISCYCYFTSSVGGMALLLYLPFLHSQENVNFKDMNTHINVPGIPPIPSSDLIPALREKGSDSYTVFLEVAIHLTKVNGIIANTFESLESQAIGSISKGLCVPGGSTPPIYCIGPIIASDIDDDNNGAECLSWLDLQPPRSVVFLCFGSMGVFSKEQLKEIAVGLERSKHRFLWVIKNLPTEKDENKDLETLLPEGFLERNKERGLIMKTWAPQREILKKESIGGFVSHCGWNSTLEAVTYGVPIIGWPLYAEQSMNKVLLVKQMKIAMAMVDSDGDWGLVSAEQVEKKIKQMMESEEGKQLRSRTWAARQEAQNALREGGTSHTSMTKLIECFSI